MNTTDQDFWEAAAHAALGGILSSGIQSTKMGHDGAATDAALFADALLTERNVRLLAQPSLSPTSFSATEDGIPASTFDVTAGGASQQWSPHADVPWITVSNPTTPVIGDATVTFAVEAQQAGQRPARTGHIIVDLLGLIFTVDQNAGSKKVAADPNNPIPENPEPEPEPPVEGQMKHPVREVHREHEHPHHEEHKKKHR